MTISEVRLAYDRSGNEPAIVLLQGADGGKARRPTLPDAFDCIFWDLHRPFAGDSAEESAEELRRILDELAIRRAHILCLSAGRLVGLEFSARYPERVETIIQADLAFTESESRAALRRLLAPYRLAGGAYRPSY